MAIAMTLPRHRPIKVEQDGALETAMAFGQRVTQSAHPSCRLWRFRRRRGVASAVLHRLNLALPDTQVVTFALPQVSWEPMLSIGPEAPLGAIADSLGSDGAATIVRTDDPQQTLVAVAPARGS